MALAGRILDLLNPIVVKEMRQILRGRAFAAWLLVLLAAASVTVIIGAQLAESEFIDTSLGLELALALIGFLNFLLLTQLPISTYLSLAGERDDGTLELVAITALDAPHIARGKITAALAVAMLFVASLLPFVAFTYFLRGVDVLNLLLIVILQLAASLLFTTFALAVAMVIPTKPLRNAAAGLLSIAFVITTFVGVGLAALVIRERVAQQLLDLFEIEGAWLVALGALFAYVSSLALFYAIAVGRLRFASANRARPVRLVVLAQWAGAAVLAWLVWRETGHEAGAVVPFAFTGALYWYVVGMLGLWQDEMVSRRIFLPWSKRPRELRFLSAFLLPGQTRAFALFSILLLGSGGLHLWLASESNDTFMATREKAMALVAAIYAYAYLYVALPYAVMGGRLARRSVIIARCLALGIPAIAAVGPFGLALMTDTLPNARLPGFWLSPFLGIGHVAESNAEDLVLRPLGIACLVAFVASSIFVVRDFLVRPDEVGVKGEDHVRS